MFLFKQLIIFKFLGINGKILIQEDTLISRSRGHAPGTFTHKAVVAFREGTRHFIEAVVGI